MRIDRVKPVRWLWAILAATLAAAALGAAPVAAQETGTLIRHRAAQMEGHGGHGARLTMRDFAACLVDRAPGRTARLLMAPIDSPEYAQMMKRLFDREDEVCLADGQLRFAERLLMGNLFDAAYDHDFARAPSANFSATTDSGYVAIYKQPYSSKIASALALEQFGECVAHAQPATVRTLLAATPGTSSEKQAFADITPALGPCLPTGGNFAFSRAMLRGALAEGIYRLSKAAAPAG